MYIYHNYFGAVSVLVIVASQNIKNRAMDPVVCSFYVLLKMNGYASYQLQIYYVAKSFDLTFLHMCTCS